MKKLTYIIILAAAVLAIASSADALQMGYGYASINLNALNFDADGPVFVCRHDSQATGYALALSGDTDTE